jgi:RNA polymerase sigma-70 factor (ECF subfamily)
MTEFDAFFHAHRQPIYSYLARLTGDRERASDLFQRVFLKAYTHFGSRKETGSERSWIYTIATNEARDEIRRRKRDPLRPMEIPDVREDGVDPSSSAGDRELAREILRGIESLPLPQREIFLLVRYHGFTFADAAAATGVSLSAAKMSVTRAHEKLLRLLGGRLHLESLL